MAEKLPVKDTNISGICEEWKNQADKVESPKQLKEICSTSLERIMDRFGIFPI